jgi:hypothetical protein
VQGCGVDDRRRRTRGPGRWRPDKCGHNDIGKKDAADEEQDHFHYRLAVLRAAWHAASGSAGGVPLIRKTWRRIGAGKSSREMPPWRIASRSTLCMFMSAGVLKAAAAVSPSGDHKGHRCGRRSGSFSLGQVGASSSPASQPAERDFIGSATNFSRHFSHLKVRLSQPSRPQPAASVPGSADNAVVQGR